MNYELTPEVLKVTPFNSEGGALAAVKVQFGPISVNAKLCKRSSDGGIFLSMPARKSENNGNWYEYVDVRDQSLMLKATSSAIEEYNRVLSEQKVAV